jgi:hypothetical protein
MPTTTNKELITEFQVPDKLKEYGITRLVLLGQDQIKAQYNGMPIVATYDPKDITGSMKRFRKDAGNVITSNGKDASEIVEDLIRAMTDLLSTHAEKHAMDNAVSSVVEKQQQRVATVMKYTEEDVANSRLWETVKVGGRFYLVSYDKQTGKFSWWSNFGNGNGQEQDEEQQQQQQSLLTTDEDDRILQPYNESGIEPYSFTDPKELEQCIQLAKLETAGSLFQKVKRWVQKFYDTDTEPYIDLIAADVVFTYFQDRLSKTHYIFVYGEPDTGKGSILEIFNQLGYRAAQVTNASAASIYRMLGSVEKGQVIVVIDEANRLEDDAFLLDVLKIGYKGNSKVPKVMDASSSENNRVEYFYAYGFKIIAAEHLPDHYKTGGFRSRCFEIKTAPGNPKLDINDIVDNAGDTKNAKIMRELTKLRKLLFAYRLLHYSEPIPDVMIKGITGRDRELIKPLIRLFKTHGDFASLKTVKDTLHYFIKQRNEDKVDSFTAGILKLVKQRIAYNNGGGEDEYELTFSDIWQYVKEQLDGESVEGKPGTIRTDLFGEISTRRLTTTLRNLGGKASKDTTGNKRVWTFDSKTLGRFSTVYRQIPDTIELEEQATLDSTTAYDDDDNNEEGLQSSDTSDTSDRSF